MGFYPVCPGTDQYIIGAPYMPYLKLQLENGGTLEFIMDSKPNKKRGLADEDKPYSLTNGE